MYKIFNAGYTFYFGLIGFLLSLYLFLKLFKNKNNKQGIDSKIEFELTMKPMADNNPKRKKELRLNGLNKE